MICIIGMDKGTPNTNPQPTGWIIATDIDDARRQAESIGDTQLAQWLYSQHYDPQPGKYDLPEIFDKGQRFMLVN